MIRSRHILQLLLLLVVMPSCRRDAYHVDVSAIKCEITAGRLEKRLFESDPATLVTQKPELEARFGEFMKLFGYVINIGDINDPGWMEGLVSFSSDRTNWEVYKEVAAAFPDLGELEEKLEEAGKHLIHYFPGIRLPDIYTFTSGFNNSIVIGDSVLGIGLDRYLGRESRYYPMLGLYNYMIRNMVPEKIPSDCMYAFAKANWASQEAIGESTLLGSMLTEGKLLYFTRCMLPDESDTLVFGFTGEQMQFCRNNESQMWEYLVEHDLLFSSDPMLIRKFTSDAPFTSYFTNESPGRAASWVGFRIIEEFMRNNPGVSLEELMGLWDFQRILQGARYSP